MGRHLKRLWEGAAALDMDPGLSHEELAQRLFDTLIANDASEKFPRDSDVTFGNERFHAVDVFGSVHFRYGKIWSSATLHTLALPPVLL